MIPESQLPVVVFPVHDPDGSLFPHLRRIRPDLERLFARAFASITPPTWEAQRGAVEELAADGLYQVLHNPPGSTIGDHFASAYARAAEQCAPAQQLHLCTSDRLAYALQSEHREAFIGDVVAARGEERPLLFQRSPRAWATHPRTYQAVESMATRVGRSLDFAWCHLAVRAASLRRVLPQVAVGGDLAILAQIVIALHDEIVTQDVDWLAWEDPFLLGQDPQAYKEAQENNPADHDRRLAYTIVIVRTLLARASGQSQRSSD